MRQHIGNVLLILGVFAVLVFAMQKSRMGGESRTGVKTRMLNILLILVVFAVLIFALQNKLIFFPLKLEGPPSLPTIPGRTAEHVVFENVDGQKLYGVWIPADPGGGPPASHPTILFSHGNAGNLTHRFDRLVALATLPANLFLYDYRGYGRSEGSPTVSGVVRDGKAALKHLLENRGVPLGQVVMYGESIGAGVAVAVAADHLPSIRGIVIESGFRSLSYRAGKRFPVIGPMVLADDLPSDRILGGYTGPLLVIHSRSDGVIPFEDGEALFAACPSARKAFFRMEGVGHNDPVWEYPGYIEAWRAFLRE